LVGDTAGFIDPVFSSGLFIAMEGALTLAQAIQRGTPRAFRQYERHVTRHLNSWLQIVSYFYDGQLFTCFQFGQQYRHALPGRLLFPHMDKHMGRIFTGAAAMAPYSRWLLNFSMKMTELRSGENLSQLAIS
jgi:2-polyprenyl-6-methoxyphenol hydroxylase-like FAD-dependent oxidoreductase